MAYLELPTRKDIPSYSYKVQLEGVTYETVYLFNDRMNHWTFALNDSYGNSLIAAVPLVANWRLFGRFVYAGLPPGAFSCFDTSGAGLDPGRYDLGDRCRMLYEESGT